MTTHTTGTSTDVRGVHPRKTNGQRTTMASKWYAKKRASRKARQVFRQNKRKPKRSILKKFANFVGKVTYKTAKKSRKGKKRRYYKRRY